MPEHEKERSDHLFLFGETTDEACQEIVTRVLADWGKEFTLFINSDGGSSFNALSVVNVLKAHGRIDTVCLGVALSGAADILAAGRRRSIVPNAIAMIHQVSWDLGNEFAANLVKNARFLERLNDQMAELLSRDSGQSKERLLADMTTDFYLFGQEILDYGLADGYWEPSALSPSRGGARESRRIRETFDAVRRVERVDDLSPGPSPARGGE
jgi:ATP-dependent Clp protease protease subunit